VKQAALELDLPVVTPERSRDALDDIRNSGAELGVVVAFGQLIPPSVLEALPLGYVNLHFSLLPRWRGAAPVERAVLAGDAETGVCLMQLEKGLDTGPVYFRAVTPIGEHETAGELRTRLVGVGTDLLVGHIADVPGTNPVPQEGEETYAAKLTVEEFELDWTRPAAELDRVIRAASPKPGAWTTAQGKRFKVLRARPDAQGVGVASAARPGAVVRAGGTVLVGTGDGMLILEEVQPETKPAMAASAWAAGFRGEHLGG
jgi:methionyl-tRNA formyltransferase